MADTAKRRKQGTIAYKNGDTITVPGDYREF
jgi:hypothetical protein